VYTECWLQVPIKCNGKPGVWRLADNLVECTDQGCTICQVSPAQDRFMKRSGPHGFSKHSGMSAEAIWRSAFKVEAEGETLMWPSECILHAEDSIGSSNCLQHCMAPHNNSIFGVCEHVPIISFHRSANNLHALISADTCCHVTTYARSVAYTVGA